MLEMEGSGSQVILFKACPRCAGDVDATYHDDVHCVQCAYRPTVVFPGPRIVEEQHGNTAVPVHRDDHQNAEGPGSWKEAVHGDTKAMCPKCGSEHVVQLDRLRPQDNVCYRCRSCGHIFSPGESEMPEYPDAALP